MRILFIICSLSLLAWNVFATESKTVNLTNGGTVVVNDITVTCTGQVIKRDVVCWCSALGRTLTLSRTLRSGEAQIGYYQNLAECQEAIKTRAECQ